MRQSFIILASLAGAIVLILIPYAFYTLYEYCKPRTFYNTGISDQEYIAITDQTLEAQKFREKYPNSSIYVDRSGALAVDYRVEAVDPMQYLRLRVFIDWRTNKPADMFIDIGSGIFITEDILEYIETTEFPK